MLSLKMVKLFFKKIVQKVDHRWRSPLVQKEDMTRPLIEGWAGEPFYHSPNSVLVPSVLPCPPPQPDILSPQNQHLCPWSQM